MQLRDYWKIFSKRWWLIILVAAAATCGSLGWSKFIETPKYQTIVRIDVSPSRYDNGLTLVIESLLRQYSQQWQTDALAQTVSDQLKLDKSPEEMKKDIKVSPNSDDYALEMQVEAPDPNMAQAIAKTWAEEFVKEHQVQMATKEPTDRIDLKMRDLPRPGELSSPKTKQNALAAGILGLVIGAILVFFLEYLDDTFKTQEDIERFLKLPFLGTIPNANNPTGSNKSAKPGSAGIGEVKT